MNISRALVMTEHASQYLRQLCRHWSHRYEVTFDDHHGTIHLPSGPCLLTAEPNGLRVELHMQDSADQSRVQHVVEEHLQRFGFKEQLKFEWQAATESTASTSSGDAS